MYYELFAIIFCKRFINIDIFNISQIYKSGILIFYNSILRIGLIIKYQQKYTICLVSLNLFQVMPILFLHLLF